MYDKALMLGMCYSCCVEILCILLVEWLRYVYFVVVYLLLVQCLKCQVSEG